MSQIRVDSVEGESNNPPILSFGTVVPAGTFCTIEAGLNYSGILTVTSHRGTALTVGVVTAASYVGNGSSLSNLPIVSISKAFGYTIIA